ncbi:VPS72/YL1 family protein [Pleurotus pulmonarius]
MADEEPTEFLATRRSKRSTAGNRMEMALAEMGIDDLSKDQDDDRDFHVEKDEEDIFESDFDSTDEEAPQTGIEPGEQIVEEEEKRARKLVKSRLEKATAAAHERQKATFEPDKSTKATTSRKPKTKPRFGRVVVDAETGKVLQGEEILASSIAGERKSKRRHTILNTSATVSRLKLEEEKRASAPKKSKVEAKSYTQDELIARALDNEEGNIIEHRNYLQLEDEKRKRARVVRTAVSGPLLRWTSRVEEEKVLVTVQSMTPPSTSKSRVGYSSATNPNPSLTAGEPKPTQTASTFPYGQYPYTTSIPHSQATTQLGQNYTTSFPTTPYPGSTSWYSYQPPTLAAPEAPKEIIEKVEKVTKCYVVHEVAQGKGAPKPGWTDTMEAMFGDHVRWQDLKVYSGRNRPLGKQKHKCPITGRTAKYLDPRSGVPFADVQGYQVLTRVLNHERYDVQVK